MNLTVLVLIFVSDFPEKKINKQKNTLKDLKCVKKNNLPLSINRSIDRFNHLPKQLESLFSGFDAIYKLDYNSRFVIFYGKHDHTKTHMFNHLLYKFLLL